MSWNHWYQKITKFSSSMQQQDSSNKSSLYLMLNLSDPSFYLETVASLPSVESSGSVALPVSWSSSVLRSLLLLLEHFSKKSSSSSWETMWAQAGVPTLRDNCPMPLVKISRLFKASTQTSEMNVQQVKEGLTLQANALNQLPSKGTILLLQTKGKKFTFIFSSYIIRSSVPEQVHWVVQESVWI